MDDVIRCSRCRSRDVQLTSATPGDGRKYHCRNCLKDWTEGKRPGESCEIEKRGVDAADEKTDEAVAREVFGLSQEQIDAWPWGVPAFSSDRRFAAGVVSKIWLNGDYRKAMERCLSGIPGLHGGMVEALMVCTPDEICKAALSAIRKCNAST